VSTNTLFNNLSHILIFHAKQKWHASCIQTLIMNNNEVFTIIQKFEIVSRSLANKWGKPESWQDIYSDMCCALVTKNSRLKDKPEAYVIRACKNEAINNYLRGKSVCSKPREDVLILSMDCLSEGIPSPREFVKEIHLKILIEKIFRILTAREKQVASLIQDGYTEKEIAQEIRVSQQRVNRIKKKIRQKVIRLLHKQGVI